MPKTNYSECPWCQSATEFKSLKEVSDILIFCPICDTYRDLATFAAEQEEVSLLRKSI